FLAPAGGAGPPGAPGFVAAPFTAAGGPTPHICDVGGWPAGPPPRAPRGGGRCRTSFPPPLCCHGLRQRPASRPGRHGARRASARRAHTSPYELEARYCTKRDTQWVGYKLHLSETCEPAHPDLITQVLTTPSTTPDCTMGP